MELRRVRTRNRKLDSPPNSSSPASPVLSTVSIPTVATSTRGRPRKNANIKRSVSHSPTRLNSKRNLSVDDTSIDNGSTKIIVMPSYPKSIRNVQTNCKPQFSSTGSQCKPENISVEVQTDPDYSNKVLIPVPVPLYIPQPMYMYSLPFPVPVPIPLPIPVPVFIPTTRNSADGIMKEIKKIQDKMPVDPYEAELLMMAEMVAEEKQETDSSSDSETKPDSNSVNLQYNNNIQNLGVETTNTAYGNDVLQMAFKMATSDYEQQPTTTHTVDLESAMVANTITNPSPDILHQSEERLHEITEEEAANIHLDQRFIASYFINKSIFSNYL